MTTGSGPGASAPTLSAKSTESRDQMLRCSLNLITPQRYRTLISGTRRFQSAQHSLGQDSDLLGAEIGVQGSVLPVLLGW